MPLKRRLGRFVRKTGVLAGMIALLWQAGRAADSIPAGWQAENMKPIGYSNLDGRGGAFKMAIRQVNGRWYLYMGHLWNFGWSIVDVTDPTAPTVVKFVPGPANTHTDQMELHDNIMITALSKMQDDWGGDPNKPFEEGVLIWDISDPLNPKQLAHWKTGLNGTHRDGYPGGKYLNLSADAPGFRGRILIFLDISDPAHPKEAGRWWMYGQKEDEPKPSQPISFHGPVIVDGNKGYVGYGPAIVILDLSDIAHPKQIGRLDVSPPFGGLVAHDVLKIPGKPLLFAHSEAGGGDTLTGPKPCSSPLNMVAMIDIKDESKPRLMSTFPLPVPPTNAPYSDFCDKGGRFGPHNTSLEYHLPDVQKTENLIYLTYFNAGVRVFDIKDPRQPSETGWFIPPTPTERFGPIPQGKLVTQTEDVLADTRGNIYITDKQWGLWVLRYTGKDAPGESSAGGGR